MVIVPSFKIPLCRPKIYLFIIRITIYYIAKLGTKKHKVIDKCNSRDKVKCPLEGKCKQECVMYKVEVYSDSNNKRNKKIYKAPFIPRLSDLTANLRELLRKDTDYD